MVNWNAGVCPFLDEEGARVLTGLSAGELGARIPSNDGPAYPLGAADLGAAGCRCGENIRPPDNQRNPAWLIR